MITANGATDIRALARKEANRLAAESADLAQRHRASAERLAWAHLAFGLPTTLLAGVTSVAAFAEHPIDMLGISSDQLAGVIALAIGVLSGASTFLDANKRAAVHRSMWARYESIRHKAVLLGELELADETLPTDARSLTERLGQLTAELDEANATAP